MDSEKLIEGLKRYRDLLLSDVLEAYKARGSSFGSERFKSWQHKFFEFLDQTLPGESTILSEKLIHYCFFSTTGETDAQCFWREDGDNMVSYIDSLILDIKNGEYIAHHQKFELPSTCDNSDNNKIDRKHIFIVHGHDGEAKQKTARFIEKLGYTPIILSEQANRGLTIIEKIEKYSDVGFAIVLYTPDDLGNAETQAKMGDLLSRARQNVVFEHGLLIGKIGRPNVVTLVQGDLELPNDISGVVYIEDSNWQISIAKELKGAGFSVDFNKII